MQTYGTLIAGRWLDSDRSLDVSDKFHGTLVGRVAVPDEATVSEAVSAAARGFEEVRLTPHERYAILLAAADIVRRDRVEFERTIVEEAGFTTVEAAAEVERATVTFTESAEEAKRLVGHMVPIQGAKGADRKVAWTVRAPLGVVCAIGPFNSPLNTLVHKVGPAIAAGNTVVVKPATYTPLSAAKLCDALLEAGLPPSHLSLVFGGGSTVGMQLLRDPRIAFYHFTGSTEVGMQIAREVGLRRTALELGSISPTIVCRDADLHKALPQMLNSAFRKAGQVCTSVQRVYVERPILDEFVNALAGRTAALSVGDPHLKETDIGPLIQEREAVRVAQWVDEAVSTGASVVTGGTRQGACYRPTILTDVEPSAKVMSCEVFGPVLSVIPFDDFSLALADANATEFGLAAGVFTQDQRRAFQAIETLRTGTVHINGTSSSRIDMMPYGGVKASGSGKEGPRYAMEEMTEERLVVFHDL